MAAAAQPRRGAILLPAISAHRGGCETAPAGTMRAYREALAAGADYLEFDFRATAGGTLVAFHPARVAAGRLTARRPVSALSYTALCELAGYEVPTAADLLALAAQAQAAAHIDLKDPACTAEIAALALGLLPPERIVVTARDRAVIGGLRRQFPEVPAGLTIGGDLAGSARYLLRRTTRRTRSRLDDVTGAGASWAVIGKRAASAALLAGSRSRGLRTMIWTVDADRELRHRLASPDLDVLVTDRPGAAVRLRGQAARQPAS